MNENEKISTCVNKVIDVLREYDTSIGLRVILFLLLTNAQEGGNTKETFLDDISEGWDFYEQQIKEIK